MSSAPGETDQQAPSRVFGKIRKRFQSLANRAMAICVAVAAVICVLEICHCPPVHPELSDAELRLEDHYFLLRNYLWPNGGWRSPAVKDVVLISVDQESAQKLGIADVHQCPKKLFASLLKTLEEAEADVVVLDAALDATTRAITADTTSGEGRKARMTPADTAPAVAGKVRTTSADTAPAVARKVRTTSADTAHAVAGKASTTSADTGHGEAGKARSSASETTNGVELRSAANGPDTASGEDGNADNNALLEELRHAKNVVLSSGLDRGPATEGAHGESLVLLRSPGAPFIEAVGEDSGSVGNNVIIADSDGMVRRGTMLFDQLGPAFYKSLALRVVEKKVGARSIVDDHGTVYIRDRLVPAVVRINYAGPPGSYRAIPLWRALSWKEHAQHGWFETISGPAGESTEAAQNPFQHKVVVIGIFEPFMPGMSQQRYSYGSSVSNFLTPAAPPPTSMNGVEIQANLITNVMHRTFLSEPDQWEMLLLILFVGILVGRILARCAYRPFLSLSAMALLTALWLSISFYAFASLRILIPVVVPIAAVAWPATIIVLLDQYFKIKREKAKQTKLFRSLAAKPLANEIERRLLAELGLTGKLMNVTIAACQLHDFSQELEGKAPEQVLQILNQCLGVMMATIGEHGGLVERVWNCGVIGLWGAPIAMDESAQVAAAAQCIGDMRARLKRLDSSSENSTRSPSPFGLTCAINSGDAICGTIDAGSRDSSLVQYGALGPTVDLAMQLDSFNRQYGTTCIVGPGTARFLAEGEARELDRVVVGANNQHQSVYELLSVNGALSGLHEEAIEIFRQARRAFEDGRFREAEQLFVTAADMMPGDKATTLMLDRCRSLLSKSEAKQT
ncbi:MAG TPA: CHASE2 domain-containing protein [Drouetiella sp.]|jgi:CHASE2 domain-containing sensor protein/class 3 adenylate cyclase